MTHKVCKYISATCCKGGPSSYAVKFGLMGVLAAGLAFGTPAQTPVAHRNSIARFTIGAPKALAHEAKDTVLDFKRHPISWGLMASLQLGLAYADTATSCRDQEVGAVETGPAHLVLGRHPSCKAFVFWTTGAMSLHLVAEHKLSTMFLESCQREAVNKDSRWWNTPAHTHDPNSCRWAIPAADTLALGAYEIPIIHSNAVLAGRRR